MTCTWHPYRSRGLSCDLTHCATVQLGTLHQHTRTSPLVCESDLICSCDVVQSYECAHNRTTGHASCRLCVPKPWVDYFRHARVVSLSYALSPQAPVPTSQQAHSAQSAALSGFPQVPVHTAHGQGQAAHAPAGTGPALGVAMPESGYIPFRQATVGEHRSPQQQQQQQAPISKPGTTGAPSSATVPSSTPSEGSKTSSASWQASGAATAAPWNTATSAAPPRQAPSQQAPSAGAGGADVQQKPKRSGLQSIASLSGVSKDYMSGEAPPLIPTSTAAQVHNTHFSFSLSVILEAASIQALLCAHCNGAPMR